MHRFVPASHELIEAFIKNIRRQFSLFGKARDQRGISLHDSNELNIRAPDETPQKRPGVVVLKPGYRNAHGLFCLLRKTTGDKT